MLQQPRSRIDAWVAPKSLAAATSSLHSPPPRRVPTMASWVGPKAQATTLIHHVGGAHLECGGGGMLYSDAASARVLSNNLKAAT
jgi:hypothetical protein